MSLQLEHVSVGDRLHDVSLTITSGTRLGVVGPSGSGKSTLVGVLSGMIAPSAGTVYRASDDRLGIIPQDPGASLAPHRSVRESILEPINIARGRHRTPTLADATTRIPLLVRELGLDPSMLDCFPTSLSGGQRQRVAIARALITNPTVLLADEASSALDAATVARFEHVLLTAAPATVLVTHDITQIQRMCSSVLVLDAGHVVEQGPVEMLDQPEHPATRMLVRAAQRLCSRSPGGSIVESAQRSSRPPLGLQVPPHR